MNNKIFTFLTKNLLIVGLFSLANCASNKTNNLNTLYETSAKQSDLYRNPVIVIPGILGSKLTDTATGVETWGVFSNKFTTPNTPEKARQVALPLDPSKPLSELTDTIVSTNALDRLKFRLLGIPIQSRAYAPILHTLGVGGYRDETLGRNGSVNYDSDHFTCYQFHYDWRRSNVENAALLDQFIETKRKQVRAKLKEQYGVDRKNIKFDIVAHSMGGLVTRYYMRYGSQPLPTNGNLPKLTWAGAKNVENVILVGTPSHGSVLAYEELLSGKTFAPKWLQAVKGTSLPSYPAQIMGTYPSIYELMPRTRHLPIVDLEGNSVDVYNAELWKKYKWGLLSEDKQDTLSWLLPEIKDPAERKAIAAEHLEKSLLNAKRFHQALDRKGSNLPSHIKYTLIAGDTISTKERVMVNPDTAKTQDNHYNPGDGVVLRSSVIADERLGDSKSKRVDSPIPYTSVIFLPKNHLNLTKDRVFADNVLYKLLDE